MKKALQPFTNADQQVMCIKEENVYRGARVYDKIN
jgi:hypothetical protein